MSLLGFPLLLAARYLFLLFLFDVLSVESKRNTLEERTMPKKKEKGKDAKAKKPKKKKKGEVKKKG